MTLTSCSSAALSVPPDVQTSRPTPAPINRASHDDQGGQGGHQPGPLLWRARPEGRPARRRERASRRKEEGLLRGASRLPTNLHRASRRASTRRRRDPGDGWRPRRRGARAIPCRPAGWARQWSPERWGRSEEVRSGGWGRWGREPRRPNRPAAGQWPCRASVSGAALPSVESSGVFGLCQFSLMSLLPLAIDSGAFALPGGPTSLPI